MKIVILAGGDSSEREISLRSGKEVFNALKKKGHELFLLDPVEENFCEKILKIKPDCVFIALHGGKGEGGIIQGFLETLNIPYTGSDTLSSAICLNKLVSKKILKFHKIPTPDFIVVDKSFSPEKIPFKYPVVVKPASQGSTIGIKIVEKESELYKAIKEAFNYDNEVFIEKYIDGKEVTVSIIGNENPKVMPIIEIITPTGFYDYKAKYTPGGSIHKIPPDLPENVIKKVEDGEIEGIISVVSEAELLSAKRCENEEERKKIEELLGIFRKIEFTNEIAKLAASFKRRYGVSLLDCIIAATAFKEGCEIFTKNLKDFKRIKGVKAIKPY